MSSKPTADGYLWDNTLAEEKARLDAQAEMWDHHTTRYLEALGITAGWRCLEIGAGSGTITRWLADRVSPGGTVVAADLDTRFLNALDHRAVEVRTLDVTKDPLEERQYDLVYARMLLMHLPNAEDHLRTLVRAVRPGGWILVQDVDLAFGESPASRYFNWPPSIHRFSLKVMRALNNLLVTTGASPEFARDHPRRLLALGLQDVGAEVVNRLVHGDSDGPYYAAFDRVKEYLVQFGGLNEKEVQRRLRQLGDPDVAFSSSPMISAWGRVPA